jgi:hypothetical protein
LQRVRVVDRARDRGGSASCGAIRTDVWGSGRPKVMNAPEQGERHTASRNATG